MARWRCWRIGLECASLGLCLLLFLGVGPDAVVGVTAVQFVPSLLTLLHGVGVGAGVLGVVGLTVLAGRVYCSTLCPLGGLQDALIRLSGRRGFRPAAAHRVLSLALLALSAGMLLAGSGMALIWLDPFSIFGRLASDLLRPLYQLASSGVAMGLEGCGMYFLARQPVAASVLGAGVAIVYCGGLAWMAARHGRVYCTSVCPVGSLLGLVARVAWLRIRIRRDDCVGCGRCAMVCKAGCIDVDAMTVDVSHCVVCGTCLEVCARKAIGFRRSAQAGERQDLPPDRTRRTLLAHGLTLLGLPGMSGLFTLNDGGNATVAPIRPTTIPEPRLLPVSPPGSGGLARFNSRCTACHLCISLCPARVLQPAGLEYGLAGVLQPRLDFHAGHCVHACTVCTEICPAGALQPLSVAVKQRVQLGVARFIRENCVVVTDNTSCGACSEHCPTKAVHMVPYPNPSGRALVIPELTPDICVGCGGCEHACPTRPFRAIYVEGLLEHREARAPEVRRAETPLEGGDFPF